jgi:hypothetical protein
MFVEVAEARRARANWWAWLSRMATKPTGRSTVADDNRDVPTSIVTNKPE